MIDLAQYDLPLTEVESQLAAMVAEALGLRFQDTEGLALAVAGPQDLIQALVRVRARLDRLEELYTVSLRAKGRTVRAAQEATRIADEAWNAVSVASRQGHRRSDYVGAKEHYADNSIATLNEQRGAKQAHRLADYATEANEVIRLVHRGLDAYRSDILAIIRAKQFETHLERSTPHSSY